MSAVHTCIHYSVSVGQYCQLLFLFPPGGADKNAVIFQMDTQQIVATLRGHSKKVTGVVYHPRAVSRPVELDCMAFMAWPLVHSRPSLLGYRGRHGNEATWGGIGLRLCRKAWE